MVGLEGAPAPSYVQPVPSSIAAYLEITPDEARRQWRRIIARKPAPRQEDYLSVEVILCYALFWLFDPHSFGGGNIERLPPETQALGATFRRSPGSLASKMLNLDGSRKNCGRLEPEVFRRLAQEPDRFAALYDVVLGAARAEGLDDQQVPDVLSAFLVHRGHMLGQEELGSREMEMALQEQRDDIGAMGSAWAMAEQETTRIAEQRIRLGQHRFALAVLRNYDFQCGFCGFAPHHLARHRLLVASHIKPWCEATGRERLDPRNGIAACPIHDTAFDTGLLTVNGGLKIYRAEPLRVSLVADEGTERYFGESALRERLLIPDGALGPDARYLAWHKEHVFRAA
jgi:putative restriction endonuclease